MSNDVAMRQADLSGSGSVTEWRTRLGTVIWFVLGLGFLLGLPIIFGWAAWVFAVALACAAVLAAPTAWIRRVVFTRDRQRSFAARWLRSSVAWLFILCIVVAAPIYYLATVTELRPALAPQATLTNGRKTVVFQGMQHVGSENFYEAVIYDIEKAIAEGYVLYYESVQTATPESQEFFAKLTAEVTAGGSNLTGFYKLMSEACGLRFQNDYFTLLEADKKEHPQRHVIADVDAIEMKQEYERLVRSDPAFARAHADDFKAQTASGDSSDAMATAIEWLRSGSESQKKLAGVACRGWFTLGTAPKDDQPPGPFDPIILDFRNRAWADRIVADPHDKIFITYGANHLTGVFELLQKQDPTWKVTSVKWLRTIEVPKQFERELGLSGSGHP